MTCCGKKAVEYREVEEKEMTKKEYEEIKAIDVELHKSLKTVYEKEKELGEILGYEVYRSDYNLEKDCVCYNVEGSDDDYFGVRIVQCNGLEELLRDEEIEDEVNEVEK